MTKAQFISMVFMFTLSFTCIADTVIKLHGYYHNEKGGALSTKTRVLADIALVNEVLRIHNIKGYRFVLGEWSGIDVNTSTFYKSSLDGEAYNAYVLIKTLNTNKSPRIDFYVRDYIADIDGSVRGVAVQGGDYFAYTYTGDSDYYAFIHELFHTLGLGDTSSPYGNSYACGGKFTVMDERHLSSDSKTHFLSDPDIIINGQQCGHEVHYDNARKLGELLRLRFP